jgi:hypothetical protein
MSDVTLLALTIVITAGCYVGARMALPRHTGSPRIRRHWRRRPWY